MLLNGEQIELITQAGLLLKKAFPKESLQFCFNLSEKHDNVNYNVKQSGIINPRKHERKEHEKD